MEFLIGLKLVGDADVNMFCSTEINLKQRSGSGISKTDFFEEKNYFGQGPPTPQPPRSHVHT